MRKIKFRGKRIDNGQWAYGDYVQRSKVTQTDIVKQANVGGYDVRPETVGQFTGLQDSEGNDIYEGDIIESDSHITIHRKIASYSNRLSAFVLIQADAEDKIMHMGQGYIRGYNFIVIGNRHDNPELLEGGER